MKRSYLSGGALIAALALNTSCKAPENPEQASSSGSQVDKTLTINLGGEPETLDPTLNTSAIGGHVMRGLFDGLVILDEDCQPMPGAAESWEANEDFTRFTFNLRKDGKWHNGDPVTADDYVYGIQRILTPKIAAEYAKMVLGFIKDADAYYQAGGLNSSMEFTSVRAEDDYTLVYELANPTPFFLTVVDHTAWYPIHRGTVENNGEAWSIKPETYNGNGAFRLAEYRSRDTITLERVPDYWDAENVFWENVDFKMIEELPTETQAFRTGEIDVTNKISLPEIEYWKSQPEWNMTTTFGTYYLSFNTTTPPLDDVYMRKALVKAIDRELIVDRVLGRGEVVSQGIIPENLSSPQGGTYREQAGDLMGTFDIEEARKLFEQSKYTAEDFPKTIYTYDTADDHKIIAEQLQAMWKEAFDIDIELQNVEWGVRLEKGNTGDFQILRNGWYGDYLDAMTFLELYVTGNQFNRPRHNDERYNNLVEQARAEGDSAAREELLIKAEKILIEENMPIAPLFTYAQPILVQKDIMGLVRNAVGNIDYRRAYRIEVTD